MLQRNNIPLPSKFRELNKKSNSSLESVSNPNLNSYESDLLEFCPD